jgi:DNA-binding NtrC family response regulator
MRDRPDASGSASMTVSVRKPSVLVVDDEPRMAEAIAAALTLGGCDCVTCANGDNALEVLRTRGADVIVTDWRMPQMDGFELLRHVRARRPGTPVILLTAYGDIPSAVAAMRQGAFDYLTKPFDNDELRARVARAAEMRRLRKENRVLRHELGARWMSDVVAHSERMRAVLDLVDRVAPSRSPVLIQGESGTGKEVIARLLHVGSPRVARPFVAVNCQALGEGVLESELFGHEKGAFTGAIESRTGCFERADGGSLLLDEIGEVSPAFQSKLLRILEDGEVWRVGGQKSRRVDVRILAATNRDLRSEVQAGRFREDLFFRLNVVPIALPALRDRVDDILPLARFFLERHTEESGRHFVLSAEAETHLRAHPWPGNVRELQNAIDRAVILGRTQEILPEDLLLEAPNRQLSQTADGTLQDCLDRAATDRIRSALEASGGRRAAAAAALGIDRTTLFRLIRKLKA